jgi:hypothetical protein
MATWGVEALILWLMIAATATAAAAAKRHYIHGKQATMTDAFLVKSTR